MKKEQPKILHGNQAKVDPKKKIESLYATNSVTISKGTAKDGVTPLVEDELVAMAKDFVDENHK